MGSCNEVWERICDYCKPFMNSWELDDLIKFTPWTEFVSGKFVIYIYTEVFAKRYRDKYQRLLNEAAQDATGLPIEVEIVNLELPDNSDFFDFAHRVPKLNVNSEWLNSMDERSQRVYRSIYDEYTSTQRYPEKLADVAAKKEEPVHYPGTPEAKDPNRILTAGGEMLSPIFRSFTFDNFVVGGSNELAFSAAKRVATSIPGSAYNPLFIYGRSGIGKTHLMLAIKNEYDAQFLQIKTVYVTSEAFMNEFLACISAKDSQTFRNKYRTVDALFIDDIQFLKNKTTTQEEFFHTFNELANAGKQIVLTSDRPPKEIELLDERIRTRFETGLIANISAPELETRIKIIEKKAQQINLNLPRDLTTYIAERVKDNVRQIEGVIKRISVHVQLQNSLPTKNELDVIISDFVSLSKPTEAIVDDILIAVAEEFSVSKKDLVSPKRDTVIKIARNTAMYVIREVTDLSLMRIGSFFGGKTHSTVMHSINEVEKKLAYDPVYSSRVINLIRNFTKTS